MTVILPRDGKTLQDVTGNLSSDDFNDIVENRLRDRNIQVFFPRFKMEYRIELEKDVLPALGMPSAFCCCTADFSGMSETTLFISRVIHTTFVEVNEEGTEAAGVTIVEIMPEFGGGDGGLPIFRADRPFMFVIRENSTGAILFMGKKGDV
jgi:serpin B